jgi:hypothetical protein
MDSVVHLAHICTWTCTVVCRPLLHCYHSPGQKVGTLTCHKEKEGFGRLHTHYESRYSTDPIPRLSTVNVSHGSKRALRAGGPTPSPTPTPTSTHPDTHTHPHPATLPCLAYLHALLGDRPARALLGPCVVSSHHRSVPKYPPWGRSPCKLQPPFIIVSASRETHKTKSRHAWHGDGQSPGGDGGGVQLPFGQATKACTVNPPPNKLASVHLPPP